jgi:hypothetical protein
MSNNMTSTTGFSNKDHLIRDNKEDVNATMRSIEKYNKKLNKYAFGSSIKRFDSNQEFKKIYNIDPGPGSYMNIDESKRDLSLNNDTTLTSRNHTISQYHSQVDDNGNKSKNSPGFGSNKDRFKFDFDILEAQDKPGPGSYDWRLPVKLKGGLINPKPTVSLNFNENNPLNYVRPITVNLYFKQDNPPVGKYDVGKPFGTTKKNYWKASFISKDKRMDTKIEPTPAPTDYDIKMGFNTVEKDRGKVTSSFQPPVHRKIYQVNLYDPHVPVSPKSKNPGPGQYEIFDKNTIKERTAIEPGYLNSVKLTSAFIQENTDRFGNQIYPTKPAMEVPGPDNYYTDASVIKKRQGGIAPSYAKREVFDNKKRKELKNIGPGSYNSNIEPKKISFFLNQGDKWVT